MNALNGKTVLVVDDEPDMIEVIGYELQVKGWRVLEASNGRKAFEIAGQEKIDLILTDLRMPNGDGRELLQRIHALPRPHPKVIVMTGFSDLSAKEALSLGAIAFLTKPFTQAELGQALALLDGKAK